MWQTIFIIILILAITRTWNVAYETGKREFAEEIIAIYEEDEGKELE